jgi:hypothetical protein
MDMSGLRSKTHERDKKSGDGIEHACETVEEEVSY